jgi:hypothetical protein
VDNNSLVVHVRDGNVTEVWQHWADQHAADELFSYHSPAGAAAGSLSST